MSPDRLKLGNVAPEILSSNGLRLVVKILVKCNLFNSLSDDEVDAASSSHPPS